MDLVSRSQWGARPWREPNGSIPYAGKPRGVKVHYLGTSYSDRAHGKCPAYIRALQAQHMDGNGWSDIGYSFVVCSHGSVYEGRGLKRRNSANGSTALNEGHYAVCALLGSAGLTQPPDRQLHGLRDAIEHCRGKGPAGNEIAGHRDGHATACPGDPLYAWVRRGAPRPLGGPEQPEDDMPQRRLYGTSDGHRIEIPPGSWRMVTFDRHYEKGKGWKSKKAEPSILFGPCFYSATVAVRVRGLVRGQELQIRLAHFREKEGGGWERSGGMPLSSPVHDGGSLHAVHPWQGHINGSRRGRVRVEVQHFGERAVTLDYARAEALYWSGGP